jgi:hypothetical protein
MMDVSYVEGMSLCAVAVDFERDIKLSYHVVRTDGSMNYLADLQRITKHAILVWREHGSPDRGVFHLGPFIKIERIVH